MVLMVLTIQPYNQAVGPSFRSRVEFQVDNAQLVRSTGVKVSVMALQGRKSSPQKSRPLESGNRRHAVWIAIEYSYKLGQKNEFKFWCELGWFLQRQSHITDTIIHILEPFMTSHKGLALAVIFV